MSSNQKRILEKLDVLLVKFKNNKMWTAEQVQSILRVLDEMGVQMAAHLKTCEQEAEARVEELAERDRKAAAARERDRQNTLKYLKNQVKILEEGGKVESAKEKDSIKKSGKGIT